MYVLSTKLRVGAQPYDRNKGHLTGSQSDVVLKGTEDNPDDLITCFFNLNKNINEAR